MSTQISHYYTKFFLSEFKIESNQERQRRFLGSLSLVFLVCYALVCSVLTYFNVVGSNTGFFSWLSSVILLAGVFISFFAYWCSRSVKLVALGSWLSLGYAYTMLYLLIYLWGPQRAIPAALFLIMLCSLFLLPNVATFIFNFIGAFLTLSVYWFPYSVATSPADFYGSATAVIDGVVWPVLIIGATLNGIVIAGRLTQATAIANDQTSKLNEALILIDGKRDVGFSVSNRLQDVTHTLNVTANEQAKGSQQQAEAILQVTRFFEELAQAARNIATKAEAINSATVEVVQSSEQVQTTAARVLQAGERGLTVVENTLKNSQQVNQHYTSLVQNLDDLQQHSNQIRKIITFLRTISDETHLLSLNAAIEAAGAGEYGQRFSVVAREVKGLAERSLSSSQQVNEILLAIENGIQAAAQAARQGLNETTLTLERARESGKVINELNEAIQQNIQQMSHIQQALVVAGELTGEINAATNQQSNASLQALETLRNVGTIANENVAGSIYLTENVGTIEKLSEELVTALAA